MHAAPAKQVISDDIEKVNKLIGSSLQSNVDLINEIGKYIVSSGGKRMRPTALLLTALACGYHGQDHIKMAAVIEFIHTATLLHDDVVDAANIRRGRRTANQIWGTEAAVLVGDFLYSRSFQMMVEINNIKILQIIADATNAIAQGEVLQLLNQNNPETSEQQYLKVIRNKTAKLFEAAAEVGAVLATDDLATQQACANYGLHLGTAYQIIDDILDITSSNKHLGKDTGNDLINGKPTLPFIYLTKHGSRQQQELLIESIKFPDTADIPLVIQEIKNSNAISYSIDFAKREASLAKQAISELKNTNHKDNALEFVDSILVHTY